jgi:uncharacterized membrane protein
VEDLFFWGGLLGLLYLVAVPIVALVALARAGEAKAQIAALRARLARLEAGQAVSEVSDVSAGKRSAPVEANAVTAPPPHEAKMAAAPPQPVFAKKPSKPPAAAQAQRDASPLSGLFGWFFKGNPLAKIAALLLFFGLSYLFKYSVEHALLPIELRLAGAGLLSLGFLLVGWRLHAKQPLYGLILQGTAIGAFYLTAFAAFRLYALLPQMAVFVLLLVICAASVVLSVLQRAQSLAVVAALGGYLAPVLLSSGGGSHIALFSYYAMLSLGILAVSVWQIWRPLNLVGLLFTFGVAALWGWDNYQSDFYLSCQWFLLLNFVIFGLLAPLAALRQDAKHLRFVDGSLVFGTPLLSFGMQYALMRGQSWELGAAFSCLVLGLIYLPLARALLRRWPEAGKRMALSFIALGGGFVTLAIPLALSARWTSLAWALEGLGLVWVGLSQRHRRMAWSGTLLIVLAAVSARAAWPLDTTTLLLIFGVLALCSLGAGWLWSRRTALYGEAVLVSSVLWLGGMAAWLWWVFDGAQSVLWSWFWYTHSDYEWMGAYLIEAQAVLLGLGLSAVSAYGWMRAGERLQWRLLRHSGWLLWPIAVLVLLSLLGGWFHRPVVGGVYGLAWLLAGVCAVLILKRTEPDLSSLQQKFAAHLGLCWLTLAVCGTEVAWRIEDLPWGWSTLRPVLALSALGLAILLPWLLKRYPWPVAENPRVYWLWGLAPVLPLSVWALLRGNGADGQLPSWQYLPLINPLEEAAALALLMLCVWRLQVVRLYPQWRRATMLVLVILTAWWFNGALVRALAVYGDIPWDFYWLWESRLIQTTLAIVWTCVALLAMVLAQRRASRSSWIGGAIVLGIVIAKLFVVDSARGGGLARAIAFIGVAMLIFVIGYAAPLPPRASLSHNSNDSNTDDSNTNDPNDNDPNDKDAAPTA